MTTFQTKTATSNWTTKRDSIYFPGVTATRLRDPLSKVPFTCPLAQLICYWSQVRQALRAQKTRAHTPPLWKPIADATIGDSLCNPNPHTPGKNMNKNMAPKLPNSPCFEAFGVLFCRHVCSYFCLVCGGRGSLAYF